MGSVFAKVSAGKCHIRSGTEATRGASLHMMMKDQAQMLFHLLRNAMLLDGCHLMVDLRAPFKAIADIPHRLRLPFKDNE